MEECLFRVGSRKKTNSNFSEVNVQVIKKAKRIFLTLLYIGVLILPLKFYSKSTERILERNSSQLSSEEYKTSIASFREQNASLGVGPQKLGDLPLQIQKKFIRPQCFMNEHRKFNNTLRYGVSFKQVPSQALRFMKYLNAKKGWSNIWTRQLVEHLVSLAKRREDLSPIDYPGSASQIYSALDIVNKMYRMASNRHQEMNILVAGSISPWIEAIVLGYSHFSLHMNRIVTTDYGPLQIESPQIKFVHMRDLRSSQQVPPFDMIISYSSIEHDGLGRYGDPINPDGDIAAVAEYHAMLTKNGFLVLGIPMVSSDKDAGYIVSNSHRIYSVKCLVTQVFCGFNMIGKRIDAPGMRPKHGKRDIKRDWQYQPVWILKKSSTHQCYSQLLNSSAEW